MRRCRALAALTAGLILAVPVSARASGSKPTRAYGLSKADAGPDGVSHWCDAVVRTSLAVAGVTAYTLTLVTDRYPPFRLAR
jgi:hypothetical protein